MTSLKAATDYVPVVSYKEGYQNLIPVAWAILVMGLYAVIVIDVTFNS